MTDNILKLTEESRQTETKTKYNNKQSRMLSNNFYRDKGATTEYQMQGEGEILYTDDDIITGSSIWNECSDEMTGETTDLGPIITQEEVESDIKRLKNN